MVSRGRGAGVCLSACPHILGRTPRVDIGAVGKKRVRTDSRLCLVPGSPCGQHRGGGDSRCLARESPALWAKWCFCPGGAYFHHTVRFGVLSIPPLEEVITWDPPMVTRGRQAEWALKSCSVCVNPPSTPHRPNDHSHFTYT